MLTMQNHSDVSDMEKLKRIGLDDLGESIQVSAIQMPVITTASLLGRESVLGDSVKQEKDEDDRPSAQGKNLTLAIGPHWKKSLLKKNISKLETLDDNHQHSLYDDYENHELTTRTIGKSLHMHRYNPLRWDSPPPTAANKPIPFFLPSHQHSSTSLTQASNYAGQWDIETATLSTEDYTRHPRRSSYPSSSGPNLVAFLRPGGSPPHFPRHSLVQSPPPYYKSMRMGLDETPLPIIHKPQPVIGTRYASVNYSPKLSQSPNSISDASSLSTYDHYVPANCSRLPPSSSDLRNIGTFSSYVPVNCSPGLSHTANSCSDSGYATSIRSFAQSDNSRVSSEGEREATDSSAGSEDETCDGKFPVQALPTVAVPDTGPSTVVPGLTKKPRTRRRRPRTSQKIWEYLRDLLLEENKACTEDLIKWENKEQGVFRLLKPEEVAQKWGSRQRNKNKPHPLMTYEWFARAIRHWYKKQVLLPVQSRRYVYKFGPEAFGWRCDSSSSVTNTDTNLLRDTVHTVTSGTTLSTQSFLPPSLSVLGATTTEYYRDSSSHQGTHAIKEHWSRRES